MPFKRYGYSKRRTTSKRYSKRLSKPMRGKVVNVVRKELSKVQDLKHEDSLMIYTDIDSNGSTTFNQMDYPAQGILDNEMIGNEFIVKRIDLRYTVATSIGVGAEYFNTVRVVLFWWYNSTTPSIGSILQNATVFYPIAPYNNAQHASGRFKVIYDKTHAMFYQGEGACQTRHIIKNYKAGKRIVTDPTISDRPRLFLLMVSDSVAGPHPQGSYSLRLSYTDS